VYANTLKLHKGVDNKLQFQLINQDQKPINVTGKELSFRIINDDETKLLFSKALTTVVALNGIVQLETIATDLLDKITEFARDFEPENINGEAENWFSFTTNDVGEELTLVDNELTITIQQSYITYSDSD
jgi:hypothetical protein